MYSEARKIYLSEEVLKIKSDVVLAEIETILNIYKTKKTKKKKTILDFVGIISMDEANQMKQAIAETCETVDDNDWK